VPAGPAIILTLKVLVTAVTVLLVASLVAIASGHRKLHGRINTLFFILTMTTVAGFEVLIRFFVDVTSAFDAETREALRIHLYFAVPAAVLLPAMFVTGIQRRRRVHLSIAVVFLSLWIGTFITGVFFLPHSHE
jgi:hypothetical protein